MASLRHVLQEVSGLYWLFGANGVILLGLGLYAFVTPGNIGVYQLKSYAPVLTTLGVVLLLALVFGLFKAAKQTRRWR